MGIEGAVVSTGPQDGLAGAIIVLTSLEILEAIAGDLEKAAMMRNCSSRCLARDRNIDDICPDLTPGLGSQEFVRRGPPYNDSSTLFRSHSCCQKF